MASLCHGKYLVLPSSCVSFHLYNKLVELDKWTAQIWWIRSIWNGEICIGPLRSGETAGQIRGLIIFMILIPLFLSQQTCNKSENPSEFTLK